VALDVRHPAVAYVAPFAVYILLLQLEKSAGLSPLVFYPIRIAITAAVILLVARPVLTVRPSAPWASIGIGIAVFLIWVGPDALFGYRHHWLFENAITGKAATPLAPEIQHSVWYAFWRTLGSTALVPVVEELFWRGWLMRWLINPSFEKVPLGRYAPMAFWVTAILFASEHGSYWEVGLAAGVIYNWWMVRCRTLADCIIAHAVTNGVLAAYVLAGGQWQYWL
jgi:CAAX prenyl protease-like protein